MAQLHSSISEAVLPGPGAVPGSLAGAGGSPAPRSGTGAEQLFRSSVRPYTFHSPKQSRKEQDCCSIAVKSAVVLGFVSVTLPGSLGS